MKTSVEDRIPLHLLKRANPDYIPIAERLTSNSYVEADWLARNVAINLFAKTQQFDSDGFGTRVQVSDQKFFVETLQPDDATHTVIPIEDYITWLYTSEAADEREYLHSAYRHLHPATIEQAIQTFANTYSTMLYHKHKDIIDRIFACHVPKV